MKLFKKRGLLGSAGLSLVELIISMAILAVVGTAIGGAMYVSSRGYTRGSAEVNVQEEAQVAANLICDWLVDATSVTPADGSSSTLVIVHPEGDKEIQITVSFSGDTISYSAVDLANPSVEIGSGVLAKNVTGVTFNSTFSKDRNVKISMDFEINERTYHAVTDSTSRNHDFISTGGGSTGSAPIIGFDIPAVGGTYYVVLEPGQNDANGASFSYLATVYNSDPAQTTLEITNSVGDTTMGITRQAGTNNWDVLCQDTNTAVNGGTYTFTAKKTLGDGTVLTDTKSVTVLIRRVNDCSFSADEAALLPGSGNQGQAGSKYAAMAVNLGLQNADVVAPGAGYDSGSFAYRDPREVKFYAMIYSQGAHHWIDVGPTQSDPGLRCADLTIVPGDSPSVQVTLTKDITVDLYVVAVATHSGTLTGVGTDGNNHRVNCNPAFNKVTNISGTDFTYTGNFDGLGNPEAYYDWFKITKGTNNLNSDGAGFRRGSQAFLVADTSNPAALSNTIQTTVNDYANCNYSTVLKFKPTSGGPVQTYVVSTYNWSEFMAKVNSGEAFLMRNHESNIFKLDTEYDIDIQIIAYNTSTHAQTVVDHVQTVIPPSSPYVADPANSYVFKTDTYGTWQNAYQYTGGGHHFYIYYPGFDNEYDYIGMDSSHFHVQRGVDTNGDNKPDTWVDDDTARNEVQNKEAIKTTTNGLFSSVVIGDGSGRTYNIGAYNETHYPDVSVNVRDIFVSQNNFQHNTYYRIVYDQITYKYYTFSSGQIGVLNQEGSLGTEVTDTYDLTGTGRGYIYFYRT